MTFSDINHWYIGLSIILIIILVHYISKKEIFIVSNRKPMTVLFNNSAVETTSYELISVMQNHKKALMDLIPGIDIKRYNEIIPLMDRIRDNLKNTLEIDIGDISEMQKEQEIIQMRVLPLEMNGLSDDDEDKRQIEYFRYKVVELCKYIEEAINILDAGKIPTESINVELFSELIDLMHESLMPQLTINDPPIDMYAWQLIPDDNIVKRNRKTWKYGSNRCASNASQNIYGGFDRFDEGETFANETETTIRNLRAFESDKRLVHYELSTKLPKSLCNTQKVFDKRTKPERFFDIEPSVSTDKKSLRDDYQF